MRGNVQKKKKNCKERKKKRILSPLFMNHKKTFKKGKRLARRVEGGGGWGGRG